MVVFSNIFVQLFEHSGAMLPEEMRAKSQSQFANKQRCEIHVACAQVCGCHECELTCRSMLHWVGQSDSISRDPLTDARCVHGSPQIPGLDRGREAFAWRRSTAHDSTATAHFVSSPLCATCPARAAGASM